MLLRLAGTLPDDLISQGRDWLAEGRLADLARAVVYAAVSQRAVLPAEDLSVLGDVLSAADLDVAALALIDLADGDPLPMVEFTASRAAAEALWREPADPADPAEPAGAPAPVVRAEPPDGIDEAALVAADDPGVLAVWRAWRMPADGSPWPPPRRVFVVEAAYGVDLVAVTAATQRALRAAGEPSPQVEVYPTLADVPAYQRLARGYGALLWSRGNEHEVRLATLFDEVDPQRGPAMRPEHPVLSGDDRDGVLAYLRGGTPLLLTDARMDDVVDPELLAVVPMNFVTDGRWVWTDAAIYYLDRYGLQPDAELLEHIRAQRYRCPAVDGAGIHRALSLLQEPSAQEPAWTFE
jgi:hypothetical protein